MPLRLATYAIVIACIVATGFSLGSKFGGNHNVAGCFGRCWWLLYENFVINSHYITPFMYYMEYNYTMHWFNATDWSKVLKMTSI